MQIVKLVITLDDEGHCDVVAEGSAINNKAVLYGLLELAKDLVRQRKTARPSGIVVAGVVQ